jgi:hypothetical protein
MWSDLFIPTDMRFSRAEIGLLSNADRIRLVRFCIDKVSHLVVEKDLLDLCRESNAMFEDYINGISIDQKNRAGLFNVLDLASRESCSFTSCYVMRSIQYGVNCMQPHRTHAVASFLYAYDSVLMAYKGSDACSDTPDIRRLIMEIRSMYDELIEMNEIFDSIIIDGRTKE